jgi:hypothetical protein
MNGFHRLDHGPIGGTRRENPGTFPKETVTKNAPPVI